MRIVIPFFAVLLCFLIISCSREKQPLLPKVTGKPGEVVIVADQAVWDSEIGKSLDSILTKPFEVLPQAEPSYDPVRIPASAFTNIFKSHRNIIIAKISPRNKKPRILVQRDVWAKPQIVINLFGPNDSTTVDYLHANGEKLLNLLDQAEINRTVTAYRKNRVKVIDDLLREKHHVTLSVPIGYEVGVDSADFVWISHEQSDITQSILIYNYAYTDSGTFTPEYLINKRDEFTRKFIPGPAPGSYMVVERSLPADFHEYMRDNQYCAELRGLWKLENGFMGGPFISLSILDENRDRIVTIDAFVYAPGLDKRNYVRELEAILNTFKII
jgi:hypothetical protein